jgi:hypothetical protein
MFLKAFSIWIVAHWQRAAFDSQYTIATLCEEVVDNPA